MAKFIKFLDRLVNLYLYFVVMACFLSLIPYINPNFPLFKFIFTFAGFYLIPPILGMSFSPACVMVLLVLCSIGLHKIYDKFYADKDQKIIILTPEEFMEKIKEDKENFINSQVENRKDDKEE